MCQYTGKDLALGLFVVGAYSETKEKSNKGNKRNKTKRCLIRTCEWERDKGWERVCVCEIERERERERERESVCVRERVSEWERERLSDRKCKCKERDEKKEGVDLIKSKKDRKVDKK